MLSSSTFSSMLSPHLSLFLIFFSHVFLLLIFFSFVLSPQSFLFHALFLIFLSFMLSLIHLFFLFSLHHLFLFRFLSSVFSLSCSLFLNLFSFMLSLVNLFSLMLSLSQSFLFHALSPAVFKTKYWLVTYTKKCFPNNKFQIRTIQIPATHPPLSSSTDRRSRNIHCDRLRNMKAMTKEVIKIQKLCPRSITKPLLNTLTQYLGFHGYFHFRVLFHFMSWWRINTTNQTMR